MSGIEDGCFPIELQERMYEAQNGFCAIEGCLERISEFHHILPNTKPNRNNYPNFISSPFNMCGICRKHHTSGTRPKMKYEIADIYEDYLKKLKGGS